MQPDQQPLQPHQPPQPTGSVPGFNSQPQPPQNIVNEPVAAHATSPHASPVVTRSHTDKSKKWYKSGIASYVIVVVSAIFLALIINTFILQSYIVVGSSMTPTLQDGNRLIVNKIPVTWHKVFSGEYTPDRGNIIIFNSPIKITENGVPADQLIKRVIGLPGDRVVVKDNKITVYNADHPNGFNPDDQEYGKDLAPTAGDVDLIVPEGYVFVCGDNRAPGGSFDSRTELGPIPIKNIVGRLTLRYVPLNEVEGF